VNSFFLLNRPIGEFCVEILRMFENPEEDNVQFGKDTVLSALSLHLKH